MSIRNQRGDIRSRILAYSSDGGANWDTAYFEDSLPDPVCQASIISIGKRDGKMILAHSNASDPNQRNNLTIKISYDEGTTWTKSILVDRTDDPNKLPWTAYSDLLNINKNTLGIIYERANYSEIVFKTYIWEKE